MLSPSKINAMLAVSAGSELAAASGQAELATLLEWWRIVHQSLHSLLCKPNLNLKLVAAIEAFDHEEQIATAAGLTGCLAGLREAIRDSRREIVALALQTLESGEISDAEKLIDLATKTGSENLDAETGFAYLALGRLEKHRHNIIAAERCYREAAKIAQQFGDLSLGSGALDNLGNCQLSRGLVDSAITSYREALLLAREASDVEGEIVVLNNLSLAMYKLGNYVAAIDLLTQVVAIDVKLGQLGSAGIALDNIGCIALAQGDLDRAREAHLRAIELLSQAQRKYDLFQALMNMARVCRQRGEIAETASFFRRAEVLILQIRRPTINFDRYTIDFKNALKQMEAQSYLRLRERNEREPRERISIAFEIGLLATMGEDHLKLGSEKLTQKLFSDAEVELKRALAAFYELGSTHGQRRTLNDLGVLYLETGDGKSARECFLRALDLARSLGDLIGEISALANLNKMIAEEGAAAVDLESLDALTQMKLLLSILPKVMMWQAGVATRADAEADADFIFKLPDNYDERGMGAFEDLLYSLWGSLYARYCCYDEAEEYLLKSIELCKSTAYPEPEGSRADALVKRSLSLLRVYNESGKAAEKRDALASDILKAAESATSEGRYLASGALGSYYQELGLTMEAYQFFREALDIYEVMRREVILALRRSGFLRRLSPPYEAAIRIAVERGLKNDVVDLIARTKARVLLDQLTQVSSRGATSSIALVATEQALFEELRACNDVIAQQPQEDRAFEFAKSLFEAAEKRKDVESKLRDIWLQIEEENPHYVAMRKGTTASLNDIRTLIGNSGKNLVYIEYFCLSDKILVLILTAKAGEPEISEVRVTRRNLTTRYKESFDLDKEAHAPFRPKTERLLQKNFAELIEPLVRHTTEGQELLIAPHLLLHRIPFPALRVDGKYFFERNPISYVPSASYLRLSRLEQIEDNRGRSLVIGDPTGDLRGAREEALQISRLLGVEPLIGQQATRDAFLRSVAGSASMNVLHIAAHSTFDPMRPSLSGICLAEPSGARGEVGGYLTVADITSVRIPARLVTLSTCSSGLDQINEGDEMEGLASAFLLAGAEAVLVSLWAVDDLAATLFMSELYRTLSATRMGSVAAAVRSTQRFVQQIGFGQLTAWCRAGLMDAKPTEGELWSKRLSTATRALRMAGAVDASIECAEILDVSGTFGEPTFDHNEDKNWLARISQAAERLHDEALTSEILFEYRPFEDPYYWAPWKLIGGS